MNIFISLLLFLFATNSFAMDNCKKDNDESLHECINAPLINLLPSDMVKILAVEINKLYKEKFIRFFLKHPFMNFSDKNNNFFDENIHRYVSHMAFDPSGRFLVVVRFHEIEIYSVPDFELKKEFKIHCYGIKFSPEGKFLLVSGKGKGERSFIEMNEQFREKKFSFPKAAFAFNEDETMLVVVKASNKKGNSIELIDIASGQETKMDLSLEGKIIKLKVQANYIFIGFKDPKRYGKFGAIILLSFREGRLITTRIEVGGQDIHIGPCGFKLGKENSLLAIFSSNRVFIYDLNEQKYIKKFKHNRSINSIAFNTKGTKLLSSSDDETARLWDIENGTSKYMFLEDGYHVVNYAAFSPYEDLVFTSDSEIHLWDLSKDKARKILSLGQYGNLEGGMTKTKDAMFFAGKHDQCKVYLFPVPQALNFNIDELLWLVAASSAKEKAGLAESIDVVFQQRPTIFREFLRKLIS